MITQYQDIFQRYEKKYLLTKEQYKILINKLGNFIVKDDYGIHTIYNIYLDTQDYSLIRTSIKNPVYKEKIRLRSYGNACYEDNVFLELKKKYKGVVYKRRIKLILEEALNYINFRKNPNISSQIFNEIDWFMNIYNPVPKVFIAYERMAYYSNTNSDIRITFDSNIRWKENTLSLSKEGFCNNLIDSNTVLMEIKIPEAMPVWLSRVLSEFEIFPVSFSKYGTCYKNYLYEQIGGIICA